MELKKEDLASLMFMEAASMGYLDQAGILLKTQKLHPGMQTKPPPKQNPKAQQFIESIYNKESD